MLTSETASEGSPSPSPRAVTTSFLQAQQAPYPDSFAPAAVTRTVNGREIIFHDNDITVYAPEGKERLCPEGRHLIIVLNRHLESVYDLSPSDIPLLSHILATTQQLLLSIPAASSTADAERRRKLDAKDIMVGFVGNLRRDPQSPHAHLHAHAMFGPMDSKLPGASMWRRKVIFGPMNWWGVEDLRAEIRESASNNRVKSGYADRAKAPIDQVPDAGAITGLPNALDPDPYTDNQPDPSQEQEQRRKPLHRQYTADSDETAKADEPRTSTSSHDGYTPVEL